jgi:hypothetical protein
LGAPVAVALALGLGLTRSAPAVRADAAASSSSLTRYTLVHGCYSLRSGAGQPTGASAGPFRLQAATLGQYLLYGVHDDFLGAGLTEVANPSQSTVWRVDGDGRHGFTITNLGTGESLPARFVPASGCAVYPEAQVGAAGATFAGSTPEGAVRGTVEGHAHLTAFEFLGGSWHCGRPWDPYGAPYALPADCSADEQGTNGAFETFLDFGGLTRPGAMHGWPTFRAWPSPTALAEEGDYYTAIERAWKAGLRLMVSDDVDNEALCSLMTTRRNPCNDMAAVRIQNRDLHGLQDYIDAQSGGPGTGWFRLVTDPFEARQVINQGKLAVVEGIEVSRVFGCGETFGVPRCTTGQIDAGLKAVHDLGVRTFFPIHEFDNAFGGTKMIAGEQGAIVNAGNRLATGSFWTLQPCTARTQDNEQLSLPVAGALAQLLNGPLASLLNGSPLPLYPPGPQCNARGLTNLGSYVIGQMIKQHFMIQLDHMDSKTAETALSIAERQRYSGVISAHCCSSPQLFARIYATGGAITPPVSPAAAFAAQWKADRAVASHRYYFGFGWGSDMNGLASQPGPDTTSPIHYPFTSYDGRVTFEREQWGQRTFDLNTDGLANYGMYADWLQELQQLAGRPIMADMFRGAEGYLEMWERASGVPTAGCPSPLVRVRPHASFESVLYALGQPSARSGRTYRYCAHGARRLTVVFDRAGRVAKLLRTGPRH